MTGAELLAFEARMKAERGWKRGQFCHQLGVSQAKWRRHVEATDEECGDRTLELAVRWLTAEPVLRKLAGLGEDYFGGMHDDVVHDWGKEVRATAAELAAILPPA